MIRRIHISSILLLFIVAVTSCRFNEMEPDRDSSTRVNDNRIAFNVGAARSASPQTKVSAAQQGRKVFLCADGTDSLYLSASVSDNTTQVFTGTPAVKGAQVTTENLELFHVTANVDASLRYFPFTAVGEEDKADGVYTLDYYWPQGTLDFFATNFYPTLTTDPIIVDGSISDLNEFQATLTKSAPADQNLMCCTYNGEQEYEAHFLYSLPEPDGQNNDAAYQPDYVFALVQDRSQEQGVVPLRFAHCFSAVTFRLGSAFMSPEGRQVKSIVISDVPSVGVCTITEGGEGDVMFDWVTDHATKQTYTQNISFEGDATNIENNQIINADELTFMLIPHEISEDETITITFGLHAGEDSAHDWVVQLKIRDLFADDTDPEWLPGKRYTYSISAEETIGVDVTDEFISTEPMVKGNLSITNTGNVPVYVRAYIIGWWENSAGVVVDPWTENDGEWSGAAWEKAGSNWVISDADGFFYYKLPVEAGQTTEKLFDTYTLTAVSPNPDARLILNIVTQAVVHYQVESAWPLAVSSTGITGFNVSNTGSYW